MRSDGRDEGDVLGTLRVCSASGRVVVINGGPLVWVIDSPELTDNRKPSSFAADAFGQAVLNRYAGVPILPGEEIGLSHVEPADLHLRLDADIQALWLLASEVSASLPGQLTDHAGSSVRAETSRLVATCSLKLLSSSGRHLTPDLSHLRLAQLLLAGARSGCAQQFSRLERLGKRVAPEATPVGTRLSQRENTLRLSRPGAEAEGWAIRLLRFVAPFGAHAA